MKPILEYSEDRKRGELPHIKQAIEELRTLRDARCSRCKAPAVHLSRDGRMAFCPRCADAWRALTPLARRQARARGHR